MGSPRQRRKTSPNRFYSPSSRLHRKDTRCNSPTPRRSLRVALFPLLSRLRRKHLFSPPFSQNPPTQKLLSSESLKSSLKASLSSFSLTSKSPFPPPFGFWSHSSSSSSSRHHFHFHFHFRHRLCSEKK